MGVGMQVRCRPAATRNGSHEGNGRGRQGCDCHEYRTVNCRKLQPETARFSRGTGSGGATIPAARDGIARAKTRVKFMGGQEDSPMSDYKSDRSCNGFTTTPADDSFGGLWVDFSRPDADVNFVASAIRATAMRSGHWRLEPRAPRTGAGAHVQYQLKAWSEGHYARSAQTPLDTCPYLGGSQMALAWQQGWQFGDDNADLSCSCEPD